MPKKHYYELQPDSELNTIRGKNLVGHATQEDIFKVFGHIDALHGQLDDFDNEDFFGTEGWRRQFGHPDSD